MARAKPLPAGLLTVTALERLKEYGPNQLVNRTRLPGVAAFFSRFKNPLVIILVLAAILSGFLGDRTSLVIIITIVLLSISLDFLNTYRSEKAAQALEERVRVTSLVLRDGRWQALPLSQLVPGDVIQLTAGKLVPADGQLLVGKNLYVNESALTGESFPQSKQAGTSLYLGTSVTSGNGLMLIQATGKATKFAQIAQVIARKMPLTEFDKEIRDFSFLIAKITFGLVVGIFVVNLLFKHDLLASLLFSLALAVGLTPELLPLIITLNLTKGSLAMARHGVIVKKLSAIQNFGSMDVLCTDKTGTLTEDNIVLVKYVNGLGETSEKVLFYSYLCCSYSTAFENPLDRAIKAFRHLATTGYTKVDEIPFDFERKRESVIVRHDTKQLLIAKGAPEAILAISHFADDRQPLTARRRAKIAAEYHHLSNQGFRVLGVAARTIGSQQTYSPHDEKELTFVGFVAFLDPAKKSVAPTLARIAACGITIKIITGDNLEVTQKITRDIHLPVAGFMTGEDVDELDDFALTEAVERSTIFARVNPEQKMRLIQALKRSGHVVGYLGDGINDAPSLRIADIGISVNNAVDVAKETADLILLHKSLHELIEGVIEGRRTFANTLKYLMMGLSSNFGNMFSMAGASIFLPFLPMLATQILLNNLLYDTSQFAIPVDQVDPEILTRPRTLNLAGLKRFMWVFGSLSSIFDLMTFGLLLVVFHLSEHGFQTGWFVESLLTQTLVVYIIRTKRIPFMQSWPSSALIASTLVVSGLALGIPFLALGRYFHFQTLEPGVVISIVLIVALYLLLAEIIKREFYRHTDV